MLMNNEFKTDTSTGNPTGNSRCHTLASRALNMSCSFGQSARSIKSRCEVILHTPRVSWVLGATRHDANQQPLDTNVNTLRPRQDGRNFADDIFKCIFVDENVWISIKISLKFVPKGPINNIPALVQIMAWRRRGDKLLSGPRLARLPTHVCVTRPQWVNSNYSTWFTIYISKLWCRRHLMRVGPSWCYDVTMMTSSTGIILRVPDLRRVNFDVTVMLCGEAPGGDKGLSAVIQLGCYYFRETEIFLFSAIGDMFLKLL